MARDVDSTEVLVLWYREGIMRENRDRHFHTQNCVSDA
jgi:hypothetical protein